MKRLLQIVLMLMFTFSITAISAQKLDSFGSSISKKVGPKTIRTPYTSVVSYLDYAMPDNEDEVRDGKKFYYIYVWIPAVAPELGLRMMSPANPKSVSKIKDAKKTEAYESHEDTDEYFDTYIILERSTIVDPAKLTAENVENASWFELARNDDSSEMPKQPSGSSYNSLLRYESETSNPEKALVRGLYRIGFTTFKTGEVKGTFLAQIGAPIDLPGVEISSSIEELNELVNQ